jgi:hypothetical protein
MRFFLAGLAAIGVLAADHRPAEAQSGGERPWCIRDGVYGAGSWDCSYYNLRQCEESASGAGGSCWRNPKYIPSKKGKTRGQGGGGPNSSWGWGSGH